MFIRDGCLKLKGFLLMRKIILFVCCILFLAGCAGGAGANATIGTTPTTVAFDTSNLSPTISTPASTATSTTPGSHGAATHTTSAPTATPTRTTIKPTPKPTKKPTPTPTPAPTYHTCTIAACNNPWGYHLQNGDGFPLVISAPSGFCSWFRCLPDFGNESGDIVECSNGAFSWNGSADSEGCPNMTIKGWLAP